MADEKKTTGPQPDQQPAPQHLICQVDSIVQATHDIRIVRLRPIDGSHFHFLAGQYAQLGFAEQEPRDYSMASRPDDPAVEFHIRDSRDGGASSYVAESLSVGENVNLRGPAGESYLRPQHSGGILAVAGGSGLAPMKSIVEEALARGYEANIRLYFGARTEADLYLLDHFADLQARYRNFTFIPAVSEGSNDTAYRIGMVTEVLAEDIDATSGEKAYLAGPPAMVNSTIVLLRKLGFGERDIHADAFYTEAEKFSASSSP